MLGDNCGSRPNPAVSQLHLLGCLCDIHVIHNPRKTMMTLLFMGTPDKATFYRDKILKLSSREVSLLTLPKAMVIQRSSS